ncbi:MAG: IS3 family transposase [Phycisphaeraceae bacterium]|nr:IS3 family transposase [Phycisphaeraceae bacterium]
MTGLIHDRPRRMPLRMACDALVVNRSTYYRRQRCAKQAHQARFSRTHSVQPRALKPFERQRVLNTLQSDLYQDQPPAQVYYALLSRGQYLCSISTMHRLLRANRQNGERRRQRPAQHHAIPRLLADKPNAVWTWDVTKLPTVRRGEYLSLYVVMDLYSRFVLAWMLSRKENSALAQQLMSEATTRYRIAAGQLTIHQDRGSPMIAKSYLEMLGDMDVTASHSRPRVSNDNPFSESGFKTLKYQPDYPGRFDDYQHADHWCARYFEWYNFEHQHSGLAGFTAEQVFTKRYLHLAKQRQQALHRQYADHPERFVNGVPKVALPPAQVAINPILQENGLIDTTAPVNFPTLAAARRQPIRSLSIG